MSPDRPISNPEGVQNPARREFLRRVGKSVQLVGFTMGLGGTGFSIYKGFEIQDVGEQEANRKFPEQPADVLADAKKRQSLFIKDVEQQARVGTGQTITIDDPEALSEAYRIADQEKNRRELIQSSEGKTEAVAVGGTFASLAGGYAVIRIGEYLENVGKPNNNKASLNPTADASVS